MTGVVSDVLCFGGCGAFGPFGVAVELWWSVTIRRCWSCCDFGRVDRWLSLAVVPSGAAAAAATAACGVFGAVEVARNYGGWPPGLSLSVDRMLVLLDWGGGARSPRAPKILLFDSSRLQVASLDLEIASIDNVDLSA